MKDPHLYIIHILECIERIERYTAGGRVAILTADMAYDAVLRNLQTLSEATQRLPADLKARHPGMEWPQIAGFRNILVHDYLGQLDPEIIWRVVTDDLPALKSAMLAEMPEWPQIRDTTP